jgi:hypothetical protein
MSPKPLLHRLGIRPNRKASAIGHTENSPVDVMAAEVIDALFKDEATALRTLGSNFDRLANSMERIARAEVFRDKRPSRVADLGGGPGIISLWLLSNGLCESCAVYDHAKSPLNLGEKWATSLGITGVTFHHQTFADLGREPQQSFDFVFAERALSFDYMPLKVSTRSDSMNPKDCPFLPAYLELARAIKNLLKPECLGFIGSGNVFPVCAAALCAALREENLSINWQLSSNRDGFQLFVNPERTMLLESFEEDALAILSDVKERSEFSKRDVLSLEKIFQNGRKYIDICSEDRETEFRCTVYQLAGLAGLFQSSSNGSKTAKFYSAGSLPGLAQSIMKDADNRRVLEKYIEPRLTSILSFA